MSRGSLLLSALAGAALLAECGGEGDAPAPEEQTAAVQAGESPRGMRGSRTSSAAKASPTATPMTKP